MLVVAGGQYDPNIGWLLRRVIARGIPCAAILNGPDLKPDAIYDVASGVMRLNGAVLNPSGVFLRHNVFLDGYADPREAQAEALNWYGFIRGWAAGDPAIRCFNRRAAGSENNKLENLLAARAAGLRIPATVVGCRAPLARGGAIRKPVAGGEYTEATGRGGAKDPPERWRPYFHQPRLKRPELRVFAVGGKLFGIALSSPDVDYRENNNVTLKPAPVPAGVARGLRKLCSVLGLDFAAADFMLDGAGRHTFLEINTQPMFLAFDQALGGKISDAIIDHLLG